MANDKKVSSEIVRKSDGYALSLKADQIELVLNYVYTTFIKNADTLTIDSGDADEFINHDYLYPDSDE